MKKIILLSLLSLMFSGTAFAAGTDEPTVTDVTIVADDAGDSTGDSADEASAEGNPPNRRPRWGGFVIIVE